ncbi:MAG: ribosome silencing factor [Armatimonadetes bacterium]|nr:ribosome silencing factor [Armatimonadota bacterium]
MGGGVLDFESEQKALRIAQAALERRAENLVVMDMRGLMSICDFFVVCNGRSRLHVDAIAEEVEEQLREAGVRPWHREGIPDSSWVITDYGDVVLHVFEPEARVFYNLEGLWGDAPRLDVPEVVAQVQ